MLPQLSLHLLSQNQDSLTISKILFCGVSTFVHNGDFRAEDFMRKYMWPNSCLPSATALVVTAQSGSQGRFTLDCVENHAARKYLFKDSILLHLGETSIPQIIRELSENGDGDWKPT